MSDHNHLSIGGRGKGREMNKSLEKFVLNEVKSSLAEIDLDSIIDPKQLKNIIKEEVKNRVLRQVSEELQLRIFKEIKQKMPIIDASVNEIVRETLYKVDSLLGDFK